MSLKEDIQTAIADWHTTLQAYRCDRPLMPSEEMAIARKVQEVGLRFVLLAFLGARNEPRPSKDYDPGLYCTLTRVFRPDRPEQVGFTWFVGLGTRAENRAKAERETAERKAKEEADLFSGEAQMDCKNAAAARAVMAEFRKKHGMKPAEPNTPEEIGAIINRELNKTREHCDE